MKIGFIGIGVVGGATAKVLSKAHKIYSYDKYKYPYNSKKNLETLAKNSEATFICVPTPMKKSGAIDYSAIYNSVDELLKTTNEVKRNPEENLVIIKSTVVSGITDLLAEKYPFDFAFNPEFLREKHALEDMENTDRVIIGAENEKNIQKLLSIYKPIFPNAKYVITDRKTAEMIKYAANVMLAGQIALANEFYQICNHIGVDYDKVKETILLDKRIGRNLDVPGPDGNYGFGGKCFPKDLNALIHAAKNKGYDPDLLKAIWELNLKVRKNKDWEEITGATSENNYGKNTNLKK